LTGSATLCGFSWTLRERPLQPGSFDSGILPRGARYARTFASAGTYRLLCSIHPDMNATLVVAQPGATAPPPATAAPVETPVPGSGEVAIIDFDYAPAVLEVPVGTTVKWTNQGVAPHTVTAKDGTFDSGFLNTGEGFTRTFTSAGTVEYLCSIHPAMVGTVVVGGAAPPSPGGGSPPPATPGGSPAPSAGSGESANGGITGGGGTGSGAGGGPDAPAGAVAEIAPGPLSTESLLRLALVAVLAFSAVAVFAGIIRSTVRNA